MEEINLKLCKVCGLLKKRILAGKWGKDKKWIDEEGKLWNGKQCPTCNQARAKDSMKRMRNVARNT